MMHNQRFDFGGITLLGHDRYKRGFGHAPDTPLDPGDRLHLTFYWQANVDPPRGLVVQPDPQRQRRWPSVAKLEAPLVSDTYPTTLWQEGDIVRGEHDLQTPSRPAARHLPAEPEHVARRQHPGRRPGLSGYREGARRRRNKTAASRSA